MRKLYLTVTWKFPVATDNEFPTGSEKDFNKEAMQTIDVQSEPQCQT
jgi:hypothetical protein